MIDQTISDAIFYGLCAFAVVTAVVTSIIDGVDRSEARKLEQRRQADARRFVDARRRGDTRGQFYAANDAKVHQTARLRREVGR